MAEEPPKTYERGELSPDGNHYWDWQQWAPNVSSGSPAGEPTDETPRPAAPVGREVRAGLGMSRMLFGFVLLAVVAGAAVTGLLSRWNPVVITVTLLLGLAVVGTVVWRSQRDLLQFKKEHHRWPCEDELDAWNEEMHARREKVIRVATAAGAAKAAESAYRQRVSQAERALQAAQRQRSDAVSQAQRALYDAEGARAAAIAQATTSLEAWRNPGRGGRIAAFKGVELFQHVVVTRRGLVPVLYAQAAVAGNLLTIQAGGTQEVIKLKQQEVPGALQFASQLLAASGAESAFEQQRPSAIPAAERYLAHVRSDTSAIEGARGNLAAAEADTALLAAIEEAGLGLDAAKTDTASVEGAQAELAAQRERPIERVAVSLPRPGSRGFQRWLRVGRHRPRCRDRRQRRHCSHQAADQAGSHLAGAAYISPTEAPASEPTPAATATTTPVPTLSPTPTPAPPPAPDRCADRRPDPDRQPEAVGSKVTT